MFVQMWADLETGPSAPKLQRKQIRDSRQKNICRAKVRIQSFTRTHWFEGAAFPEGCQTAVDLPVESWPYL